jgi:aryl-alcohol dehydrogenase (NADP+)
VAAHGVATARGLERYVATQSYYSLVGRDLEWEILPACRYTGAGVIVWSPLAGGWLTGKYRRGADAPAGSRAQTNPDHFDGGNERKFDAVERLAGVADTAGLTLTQLALAWSTEHPAVTSALIGPRTEQQLDELLTAVGVVLDEATLDAIDDIVVPGLDINPADRGWQPPGLEVDARRRPHRTTPDSPTGGLP